MEERAVSSPTPAMSLVAPALRPLGTGKTSRSSPKLEMRPVRGHLSRATRRFMLVLAGDAMVLILVTTVVAALGEHRIVGAWASRGLAPLLPGGVVPMAEIIVGTLVCLLLINCYEPVDHRQLAGRRVAAAVLGVALPYWSFFWHDRGLLIVWGFLMLAVIMASGLLLGREVIERILPLALGKNPAPALLIARPSEVQRVRLHPALREGDQYTISGIFDPQILLRRRGAREALGDAIRSSGANTVVLAGGALEDAALEAVQDAALATGSQLVGLGRMRQVPGAEPRVAWLHGAPLLYLTRPAWHLAQMGLKRAFDLVGACFGLVMLSPLMGLIAVVVKLDSPGPVFFGHQRLGLRGRPFRCYKFRSMRVDAEQLLRKDPVLYAGYLSNDYKLPKGRDPRITQVGQFLRETSLDELPQLFNVLRGEMSLVGPRPIVPEELSEYGDAAPVLLSVKPGLAGAWAVNGRSEVHYPARADLELGYVRQWRIPLDLSLLARAFPAILSRRGSH